MHAVFDNKRNVLNAQIRATRDNSVLYTIRSTSGFRGRKLTVLQDMNPVSGGPELVGAIHWRDKLIEVRGCKKSIQELRRTEGSFFNKSKYWRWSPDRKEYQIKYHDEQWEATLEHKTSAAGHLSVPFRPHLFTRADPVTLYLSRTALAEDEVFLILMFIYLEVLRQDKTSSSLGDGGMGAGSWW